MVHAQKPDFVFRRNGRAHLNRRGRQFQSTTGSRGMHISGSNAGYTMFRGSVKSTGYPLHSPVSPSLPLPCVTVCHHISTGLYTLTVAYLMLKLFDTGETLPFGRYDHSKLETYLVVFYGTVHLPTATLPCATTTQYSIRHAYDVFSNGNYQNPIL
jgi:hypothetical protein